MLKNGGKKPTLHPDQVTPKQIERENHLYSTYLQNGDGRRMLGPAAIAVSVHLLLLVVAIPSLKTEFPEPESVPPGITLQPPPSKLPPPREPPPPVEPLKGKVRKAMIPTPDLEALELLFNGVLSELLNNEEIFDVPAEYLDVPPEPPPSDITIYQLWNPDLVPPTMIADSRVNPAYPRLARLAKAEGKVILRAIIYADGTVGEIEVVDTPDPELGFAEAAVAAVSQWRYTPAMLYGEPVAVGFTIVIEFQLR